MWVWCSALIVAIVVGMGKRRRTLLWLALRRRRRRVRKVREVEDGEDEEGAP